MREPPVILLRVAALVSLGFTAALAADYYLPGHAFCEPGGGCEAVRYSEVGREIALFLPALGLIVFPMLFAGSLIRHRSTLAWTARLGILVALGALAFLWLQGMVIERWCWMCVGVDASALVGGLASVWILRRGIGEEDGESDLTSAWWPLLCLALSPLAWALTFPDPRVAEAVRELWDEDADVNVVEMVDFECPYCRTLHPILKEAIEGSEAQVHVARIMVPLPFHTHAREMTAGYFCAERQERREEMTDLLFTGEDMTRAGILNHARALELNMTAFEACLDDEATEARIEQDLERATRAGRSGLPTVYIGERAILGLRSEAGFYEAAIAAGARGEGRRVRYWPFTVLAAIALGSLVPVARRRRAAKR